MREEQLTIDGYTFSLEGTSVTRGDGMPYNLLSTGAGMLADLMLAVKFNQLMGAKAPKVIFLDNADLISTTLPALPLQLIAAYVVPELEELKVVLA